MSVAQRPRPTTSPADRGELLGTIAGLVLLIPLLGGLAYGFWLLLVRIFL